MLLVSAYTGGYDKDELDHFEYLINTHIFTYKTHLDWR